MDKIARIELYKMRIPLKVPFVISLETITHAENIALRILTESGGEGWGECSPYRSIVGETPAGAFAIARELAPLLLGRDAGQIDANLDLLDAHLYGNACIKSAFDMAFYDLAAKRTGLPLYQFLGGRQVESLRTDMTVGLADAADMAEAARAFVEEGFDTVKIKLGQSYEEDIARVEAIREAVGSSIALRVDANQGWDFPTARKILNKLAELDVEYCEAPISRRLSHLLPELRRLSPLPIMADESLFDHYDAARLAQSRACDYFNIKLAKSGGIRNARRIVAIAESHGIRSQVGCFSETRLGLSALAHFALANPNIVYHDMDSALMLAEDPVVGGMKYLRGGHVHVADAPGHGAGFDRSFLEEQESIVLS